MPVCVDHDESRCTILLEGDIGISDAVEIKRWLLDAVDSQRRLLLNLERVESVDVSFMQLLQSALRLANRSGPGIALILSEQVEMALSSAGFGPCIEYAGWGGDA